MKLYLVNTGKVLYRVITHSKCYGVEIVILIITTETSHNNKKISLQL